MEQSRFPSSEQVPSTPKWGGAVSALLYLGVYFAAQLLSALVFALVSLLRLMESSPDLGPAELVKAALSMLGDKAVSLSLISNLVTLPALYLAVRLRKQPVREALSLRPVGFERLWPLLPLGIALNGFVTTVLTLLPPDVLSGYTEASGLLLSQTGLLPLLAVAFLGPVTEEVVFRGLLYGNLAGSMPPLPAALIASALFGVLHGQIVWMGYAFCMGLVFCLVFDWYGSLWASLLLHICFNLSGGFAAALGLLPAPAALAVSFAAAALFSFLAYDKSHAPGPS